MLLSRFIQKRRMRDARFAFLYDAPPPHTFVALDTETTGLNPKQDDIIAIGAVKVVENRIIYSNRFSTLVRPQVALEQAAIGVHGIMPDEVAQASRYRDAIGSLLEFIGAAPLIGYNIAFDYAILNRAVKHMIGARLVNRTIDVGHMYAQRNRAETHDLSFQAIANALDIPLLAQHDAMNDALMTALMFVRLRSMPRLRV